MTGRSRRYLEAYITREEDCNDIVNNGLVFLDANLKAFSCSPLDDSAKAVNLKRSDLPLLPKKDVLSGLQKNLAVFGTIMGLNMVTDSATGSFMGSGYAALNIYQNEDISDVNRFQEP